ncbi:hypothetical protein TELCIR_07471 [Teladorsagia circumcincta]|uniref:Uncharacterized protein n=1 Tax=Teladorsagia circumcincta TaxID=45464 RepID=A0A2G9UMF5_TELCI|nr:hypothetical protein TELCIR_07471 [Teladorsagia circumcincta]
MLQNTYLEDEVVVRLWEVGNDEIIVRLLFFAQSVQLMDGERFVVDSTVATTSGELETYDFEVRGKPSYSIDRSAIMADDIPDSLEQINLKMNATTDERSAHCT